LVNSSRRRTSKTSTKAAFPHRGCITNIEGELATARADYQGAKLSPAEKVAAEEHRDAVLVSGKALKQANRKWVEQRAKHEAQKAPAAVASPFAPTSPAPVEPTENDETDDDDAGEK
jgi:hypothetical protein